MADPQATIQALLAELVATDQERGLQVAAYLDGQLVIDAWSGIAEHPVGAGNAAVPDENLHAPTGNEGNGLWVRNG